MIADGALIGHRLRQRLNQRGFTRTVGACHHQPLSGLQREPYLIERLQRAVPDRQIFNLQHYAFAFRDV